MTQQKKEFLGISMNKSQFQGKVMATPTISPYGEGESAAIQLKTVIRKMDANGQFIDFEQIIPLMVLDPNKVAKTVKPYIDEGRKLYVDTYYMSWTDAAGVVSHGFVVTNILLGDKPFVPKEQDASASTGLPPQ